MPNPAAITLTQTRIFEGWWEGVLNGAKAGSAVVEAWHLDRQLGGVEVQPIPGATGQQMVRFPVPASVLSEGVQTVLFRLGDQVLAHLTLIAGVPLEEDLRAEISLLRAELDVLKRAFRRHCAETAA
jgi:hypothetical protein